MLKRPLRLLSVALVVLATTAPADADASEPSAPTGAVDQFVQGWMAANGVVVGGSAIATTTLMPVRDGPVPADPL